MSDLSFPTRAKMVFCIGAQKAGTTWLYDTLRQSREVHFSPNKELHYFDVIAGKADQVLALRISAAQKLAGRLVTQTGLRNRAVLQQLQDLLSLLTIYSGDGADHGAYLSYLLAHYADQPIVCDITPAYAILDRDEFAQMGQIGTARFIFILRDPIERMWSQIRMAVASEISEPGAFSAACIARARHLIETNRLARIERADYRHTITELEAAIPKSRIQYLFHETLFKPETIDQIAAFLAITPPPSDPERHSNRGIDTAIPNDLREAFGRAFAPQYAFVRERFGDAVPAEWQCDMTLAPNAGH